jgi:hypothetical protein
MNGFNIWIKFVNNSLDFLYIFFKEKWCFSNVFELIRRALVAIMLIYYLSLLFLCVLRFKKNTFRRRPMLPENFSDLFKTFPQFSGTKSIFICSKILFHGHQKLYLD